MERTVADKLINELLYRSLDVYGVGRGTVEIELASRIFKQTAEHFNPGLCHCFAHYGGVFGDVACEAMHTYYL